MNRETKFRGKSKFREKWVYGNLHILNEDGFKEAWILEPHAPGDVSGWDMSYTFLKEDVYFDSVGEYTGLKDKNGDEIFEGDILEWKEKNYGWHSGDKEVIKKRKVVKYQTHYGAGWNFGMSHKDEAKRFSFPLPADAEIIGNKFENPNLLSND